MSQPATRAFLQEVLDASWLYRLGSAMRLGVPFTPARNVIGEEGQTTERPPQSAGLTAQPTGLNSVAKTALVGGAIALSGLAGAAAAKWLATEQPDNVVVEQTTGDLLEWLDDKGLSP